MSFHQCGVKWVDMFRLIINRYKIVHNNYFYEKLRVKYESLKILGS